MYFTTFFSKQLHFFLDHWEDQHLFIFVKNAVTSHIEHIKKLLGCTKTQQVEDMITSLFEYQTDISIIQQAFLPEVSFLDRLPDLFAFASATNQGPGLLNELTNFMSWDIGEGAESFLAYAASGLIAINSTCVWAPNGHGYYIHWPSLFGRFHCCHNDLSFLWSNLSD